MNTTTTTFRQTTIRCSYDSLAYDIANYAYIVGDAMHDDTASHSPHATHLVRDVMEGQNRDRIDRDPFFFAAGMIRPGGPLILDIRQLSLPVNQRFAERIAKREMFNRLRGLLMPFLCQEVEHHSAPDNPGQQPVARGYAWHLKVPQSVTAAHIDRWGTEVYEYMVAAVLADWFEVCAPSVAQVWKSRRDTDWRLLAESVKLHNRRAHTSLSPF